MELNDSEFEELIAFLHALTDRERMDLRDDVPKSVPSELTLGD